MLEDFTVSIDAKGNVIIADEHKTVEAHLSEAELITLEAKLAAWHLCDVNSEDNRFVGSIADLDLSLQTSQCQKYFHLTAEACPLFEKSDPSCWPLMQVKGDVAEAIHLCDRLQLPNCF